MAKSAHHEAATDSAESFQIVRDTKTGQFVTVRGVGALKGQLALKKSVDLTKPIASQALKGGKSSAVHKR